MPLAAQNIRLSAMRKVERMPRLLAAYNMSFTARRALTCQTLAIFLVDELFLICRLWWRERYACFVIVQSWKIMLIPGTVHVW